MILFAMHRRKYSVRNRVATTADRMFSDVSTHDLVLIALAYALVFVMVCVNAMQSAIRAKVREQ